MKSFKQFNEDAYAGRQGAGAWLTSKALELGARGVKKGYQAVTSFASAMDKFKERREAEKKYKEAINKGIQNTRDPEADKEVAKAAKDPDLKKLDRLYDTDNQEFNKDIKSYRKTIDKTTKKTTLPPEDQIQILKNAKNKYKKPKK